MKRRKKKPAVRTASAKSPSELLAEGKRVLRELQGTVQFNGQFSGGPDDVGPAVAAMFALASNATMGCAIAAHNPRTATHAQDAAKRMDWIAVLKGNPKRLPGFAGALDRLKTFHMYRSRGPRKKTVPETERALGEWLVERIESFWRGVVSRGLCIPPIPDEVRALLLTPENRLDGRKWAESLLDSLPKAPNNPHPFEVYDQGRKQDFFARQVPYRKRTDSVRAGFVKFASERFNPLLKREAERAEFSYQTLMKERAQTNIASR